MRRLNCFFLWLSLALLVAIYAPVAANSSTNSSSATGTDAVLTQELQTALSNHFEFRNVTASVDARVATLEGSVESYREKLEAEELARSRHKIEGIRDFIAVVPVVDLSDADLETKLADRLRYDRIGYGIQFGNLEP